MKHIKTVSIQLAGLATGCNINNAPSILNGLQVNAQQCVGQLLQQALTGGKDKNNEEL
jgi:hypothetical protein